jgi:hypothetical protein
LGQPDHEYPGAAGLHTDLPDIGALKDFQSKNRAVGKYPAKPFIRKGWLEKTLSGF